MKLTLLNVRKLFKSYFTSKTSTKKERIINKMRQK